MRFEISKSKIETRNSKVETRNWKPASTPYFPFSPFHFRLSSVDFRISSFEFRISIFQSPVSTFHFSRCVSRFPFPAFHFPFSSLECRIFELPVFSFRLAPYACRLPVSIFDFRISSFEFRFSSFESRSQQGKCIWHDFECCRECPHQLAIEFEADGFTGNLGGAAELTRFHKFHITEVEVLARQDQACVKEVASAIMAFEKAHSKPVIKEACVRCKVKPSPIIAGSLDGGERSNTVRPAVRAAAKSPGRGSGIPAARLP